MTGLVKPKPVAKNSNVIHRNHIIHRYIMFNLLTKKYEGNKEDCYLLKSGSFEQKILDDDKLELYNDLLRDNKTSDNIKDVIRGFFIPYKISLLKFSLNKEYYENPHTVIFYNNDKHIAPSLKKIMENQFDIAMGYPSWFIIAFPDVVLWVMQGDGFEIINKRFKNLTDDEIGDGNHIRPNLLNDTIKLYQSNTSKPLECKKY